MTSTTKKVNALLINIAKLEQKIADQKISPAGLSFEQKCKMVDRIDTLAHQQGAPHLE